MSRSFQWMEPLEGRVTVTRMRMRVDLPAPLGPRSPRTPGLSSKLKSRRPQRLPEYFLLSERMESFMECAPFEWAKPERRLRMNNDRATVKLRTNPAKGFDGRGKMDIGRYDSGKMDSICGGEEGQAVHPGCQLQGCFQLPTVQVENFHRACLRATDISARAEHGRSFLWESGNGRAQLAKRLQNRAYAG